MMKKKSPLKGKPLRYPGQSLDEEISDVADRCGGYVLLVLCSVMLIVMEWFRYYFNSPPSPVLYTFVFLLSLPYIAIKFTREFKKLKALKLGRDGERVIGQYLECLRENGCKVFHDIVGDKFNIDHVVISRKGVFLIESKTYSKPEQGRAVIEYDGSKITSNVFGETDKPLIQVAAATNWLGNLFGELVGRRLVIKPAILFPGWYVEASPEASKALAWVLNPKALVPYIENCSDIYTKDEVQEIANKLARYIRERQAIPKAA